MVLFLGTRGVASAGFSGVLERQIFCPTTWSSYIWQLTRHEDGFWLNSWSCKIEICQAKQDMDMERQEA